MSAADRNLTARTTGADPADVAYVRDAANHITRRAVVTGDTASDVLYSYTGNGDSADLTLGPDKKILTRSISLPGGVLYTVKGSDSVAAAAWDMPTVRGDIAFTSDTDGKQLGELRAYTPYGEPLNDAGVVNNDDVPDNQPGQMDYGWLGQHQRPYEHAGALSLVQMGARPYSPLLGRFLSADPVVGGSANDYEYVHADPINKTDLTGTSWFSDILGTVAAAVAVVAIFIPVLAPVAFVLGVASAVVSAFEGDLFGVLTGLPGIGVGMRAMRAAKVAKRAAVARKAAKAKRVANPRAMSRKAVQRLGRKAASKARVHRHWSRWDRRMAWFGTVTAGISLCRSRC